MISNGNRDSKFDAGWDDAIPYGKTFIDAAPERIVWGSDWPHPGGTRHDPAKIEPFWPEDDGAALNRLAGWTRYRDELRKILTDNPARLYDF